MYQTPEGGRRRGERGVLPLVAVLAAFVLPGGPTAAGEPVIYFSTEKSFTAKAGPHAGEVISAGDLLSTTGEVIATNAQLLENFGPEPVLPDVGLDGLSVRSLGEILFSIEEGFWDERLSTMVRQGDLLSRTGAIVRTSAELTAHFHPMPPSAVDYGLDAVWECSAKEAWFSIEEGFFDEALGVSIRPGDLLSQLGKVVMTNAQMLVNFSPMPAPDPDYGLDAVHVLASGQVWFSIEESFWDEALGKRIGSGDLLLAGPKGTVVKTNAELLAGFFEATGTAPEDYGLDAIWVGPQPGDANEDGKVNDLDASILAANWQRTGGATWSQADFNGDGDVNDLDASILAANWQYGVGPAVPEPATPFALFALVLAGWALRRRG